MGNIEVEIRSFVSKDQYDRLMEFFNRNAKFVKEDYQETYYFDTKEDLRIQKNNFFSKVWMKKGKLHDDFREETEIKFDKNDFEKLEKLFLSIGINVKIKWFRKRFQFDWNDAKVCLDYTKGYGYILELEKLTSESGKEAVLKVLKEKMGKLGIEPTSKEEFDRKFKYYEENWQRLVK